jgi:O-antigen ligase
MLLFLPASLIRGRVRRHSLSVWLILLPVAGVFSVSLTYTVDPHSTVVELFRVVMNLVVLVILAGCIKDAADLRIVCRTYTYSMVVVAVIVVAQFLTGRFLWNQGLAVAGRFNGPLADPNVTARYLAVALALSALVPRTDRRPMVRLMRLFEGAVLLFALVLTGSRSGLVVVGSMVVLALVFGRPRLRRVIVAVVPIGAILGVGLLVAVPSLWSRLATFGLGTAALGSRVSLVRGGMAMFQDHPVFGVGLGGYPASLLGKYASYQGYYGSWQSASHTSIVTVLAEQGLVGAALVGFLIALVGVLLWRSRRLQPWQGSEAPLGLVLGMWGLVLSSQSEGRFWEEPLLWALLGLLIASANLVTVGRRTARMPQAGAVCNGFDHE